ncbi:Imm7 family immunity protein [Amycolatopsis circi]|uniref:Imm7 family immunity protein n=1 Tax=Amycolatopsis circi TaxID=871959 RepID=UPI000E222206|nr:Imm7 family immunity protein [Amycolatopsis circi]
MYVVHGWFELEESPAEPEWGEEKLDELVEEVRARIAGTDFGTSEVTLKIFNGIYVLRVDGAPNHRGTEIPEVIEFLEYVARLLPGSYGLLYERDEEASDAPGQNGFRVRVMARGELGLRLDPFLSPIQPVIEDCP